MRGADPTPSPGAPAASTADPGHAAVGTRRRWMAVLAAVALPVAMLTPWYALRVSAPGLTGRHGFAQQLTGWQALSGCAIVCLLVACAVVALMVIRALVEVTGLGAAARRSARARVDGALIAAGGLLCVVTLLWTAVAPPAVAAGSATVSIHAGARWGVLVALVIAVGLTTLGVQIAAAAGRSLRDRGKARSVASSTAAKRDRTPHEPAIPDFDFGAPRVESAARLGRTAGRRGERRRAPLPRAGR